MVKDKNKVLMFVIFLFASLVFTLALVSNSNALLLDDLDHYYSFEEASGDLLDRQGSDDGDVNSGINYQAPGVNGYAYDFTGASANTVGITFSAMALPYTISVWWNGSEMCGNSAGGDKVLSFGVAPYDAGKRLLLDTPGNAALSYYDGVAAKGAGTGACQWNNYVVSVAVGGEAKFFLNGVSIVNESMNAEAYTNLTLGIQINEFASPLTGQIDEVAIWSDNLTFAEVTELWNGGTGCFKGQDCFDGTKDTLNITAQAPADNSSFTSAPYINVTFNSNNTVDCSLLINGTYNMTNNSIAAGTGKTASFNPTLGVGAYNWTINCTDGQSPENSSTYNLYIDSTDPVIEWVVPNSTNSTVVNNTFLTYINISDTNLYSYYLNISYASNGSIFNNYNFSNTTLTGITTLMTVNHTLNMSGQNGTFNAKMMVCDGHTDDEIDFGALIWDNELWFDNAWSRVKVYMEDKGDTKKALYTKKKDRYTFDFTTRTPSDHKTFIVESSSYIDILDGKTSYEGHLVTGTKWLDFEELDVDKVDVTRINDTAVKVKVWSKVFKDNWKFKSVGELNCVTETKQFYVYNWTDSHNETQAVETQPVSFNFNLTYNATFMSYVNASFYFNNTMYSSDRTVGTSNLQFNKTLAMPRLPTNVNSSNMTFWWNYTIVTNSSTITGNNTKVNLSLYAPKVDNCTKYLMNAINLTMKYENGTAVTGDINVWLENSSAYNMGYNFSAAMTGVTHAHLCVWPNWTSLTSDLWVEYTGTGYGNFHYFTDNTTLDNSSNNITIYIINGTSAVTFTVLDQDDKEQEDVYIFVLKFDATTGAYRTTEILKTDSDGVAIGNIVLSDTWYKFILHKDSSIVLETDPTIITTTSKTFRIDTTSDYFVNYDVKNGITSSLTFTNSTKNFVFTWSEPTGTIHWGCLKVIKRSVNGDTLMNETCVNSAASSILINIGTNVSTATNTYLATGYIKFDEPFILEFLSVSFNYDWLVYGTTGIFVSFLLIVTLIMVGLWNPLVALILMALGFVITNIIGLFHMDWEYLITLIILIGVAIYKMRRS